MFGSNVGPANDQMWKLAHVFVTTLKMSLSFNRVRVIIVSRVILKMQNNIYLIYYIYCMYTHTHTHTKNQHRVWGFAGGSVVKNHLPDEWKRKLWYIYTMEYYSAIKKNALESVLIRWMKLESIIQNEVSQKEKHQYSILMHIYGIQKDDKADPICKIAKETQM